VLGHPDVYRHAIDFGGDLRPNLGDAKHTLATLYRGSVAAERAHDPAVLFASRKYPGVTLWFGNGMSDARGIAVGRRLAEDSTKDGVVTHEFIGPGGHNWQFCSYGYRYLLPDLCVEMGCATRDRS
jgi:hypothetical protein